MNDDKENKKSSSDREAAFPSAGATPISDRKIPKFNDAAIDRVHSKLPRKWRDG
jgi:hypothetical protein